MKRNIFNLILFCLTMMLSVNLSSCGDDDERTENEGPEQDNTEQPIEFIGPETGTDNGYTWVNLGLPSGIRWATCNVGAENPWDYGDYFAWGETVGYGKSDPSNTHNYAYGNTYVKTYYYWDTYKYCSGASDKTLTKYNNDSNYGSVVDNKTTLDLADDAAAVNMGGSWRMPTYDEQKELADNCYWEWTSSYNGKGVAGYIVYKVKDASDKGKLKTGSSTNSTTTTVGSYSLSDTHIFLPAAGCRYRSGLNNDGNGGFYWSSSLSLSTYYPYYAYDLNFRSHYLYWDDFGIFRCGGYSVRGVESKDADEEEDEVQYLKKMQIDWQSADNQALDFEYIVTDNRVVSAESENFLFDLRNDGIYGISKKLSGKTENMTFNIIGGKIKLVTIKNVFGVERSYSIEYNSDGKIKKLSRNNLYVDEYSNYREIESIELTWKEGNVEKVTISSYSLDLETNERSDNKTASYIYEYDNKINPLAENTEIALFQYFETDGRKLSWLSKNNMTSSTYNEQIPKTIGSREINEYQTITYSYLGDYPISSNIKYYSSDITKWGGYMPDDTYITSDNITELYTY